MKKLLSSHWRKREHFLKNGSSLWGRIIKISLLATFVGGIFAANLMGREAVSNAGILNDYFVEKFQYTEINGENLFFYIVGERVPLLLLLFVLSFTSFGILGGIFMLGWQGFSVGFMLSTAIAKYGVKGILLVLAGLFPQYLFYFPVYLLYCYLTVYLRQRIAVERYDNISQRYYIFSAGILLIMCFLVIFFAGIFLESYINPFILKQILKLFF